MSAAPAVQGGRGELSPDVLPAVLVELVVRTVAEGELLGPPAPAKAWCVLCVLLCVVYVFVLCCCC